MGGRIPVSQNFGASGGFRFSPPGLIFKLHYAIFEKLGFMNELIHFPLGGLLVPPIFKVFG
jgi:hypothetical protein